MKRSRKKEGPLLDYAALCGNVLDWCLGALACLGLAGFSLAAAVLLWLALKR